MAIQMPRLAVRLEVDETNIVTALEKASNELTGPEGEVLLDCTTLGRFDGNALRALENLARVAREKEVTVAMRGVNAELYKVLKLARLTASFVFTDER
jgi:anti-anti-sigma regulatory factor